MINNFFQENLFEGTLLNSASKYGISAKEGIADRELLRRQLAMFQGRHDLIKQLINSNCYHFVSVDEILFLPTLLEDFLNAIDSNLAKDFFFAEMIKNKLPTFFDEDLLSQLKFSDQEVEDEIREHNSLGISFMNNDINEARRSLQIIKAATLLCKYEADLLLKLIANSPMESDKVFANSVRDYFQRKYNIWANQGKKTEDEQSLLNDINRFYEAYPNFSEADFLSQFMPLENSISHSSLAKPQELMIVFKGQNIPASELAPGIVNGSEKALLKRAINQAKDFVDFIAKHYKDFKSQDDVYEYIKNMTDSYGWLINDKDHLNTPRFFGIPIKGYGMLKISISFMDQLIVDLNTVTES